MGKVAHIALKKGDSRLWTPLDALKELVRAIEAGEENPEGLVIHWWEEKRGERDYRYLASKVTFPDHLALLDVAHNQVLKEWSGD